MSPQAEACTFETESGPPVRGYLHRPAAASTDAIVLAHGAGSNANAPLLVAFANRFADAGYLVLRIDLPFRQQRPSGPPFPAIAPLDQAGLRNAAQAVRSLGATRVILGGHSYGGRQATMLAATDPAVAERLLLFSYPLHPPGQPAKKRTAHFPALRTDCVFVHGDRDTFGSLDEMREALAAVPAQWRLIEVPGAGHDLKRAPGHFDEILAAIRT